MRKRKLSVKALITAAIFIGAAFSVLPGCFGSSRSSKTLTDFFGESTVVAARFYVQYDDGYNTEELAQDQLQALVDKLDSMSLKTHSFHTDYFWGGRQGIELKLEDGNYITYDGTRLELRSGSRVEGYVDSKYNLRSKFIEVTDCEFWDEMKAFFPSIEDSNLFASW